MPAIDGLRAVAVLSVLLYHLKSAWLPGGFTGVDVFFVISGFVVSLSVMRLQPAGLREFLAWFYARRLIRIAPALVVCLVLTSLVANLFIPRAWLSDVNQRTAVAAFFGFSNVVLNKSADDYFSPRTEFNPFTHTWSLGVEEQFYLVFPWLFFLWLRGAHRTAWRRGVPLAVAVLSAASLALCAAWSATSPAKAFYLIPARFWELGLGMLLLLALGRLRGWLSAVPQASAEILAWLLALGLGCGLALSSEAAFPYPWALLPVLATAGLLAILASRDDLSLSAILRSGPMVGVGKISYSLYLWHWPVFVLFRWTVGLESTTARLIACLLAFALATASYYLVEQPVRTSLKVRAMGRGRVVAWGLGGVFASAVLGLAFFGAQPWLSLSVTRDVTIWNVEKAEPLAGTPQPCQVDRSQQGAPGGGDLRRFVPTGCPTAQAGGRLFVAGDSHAGAYSGLLRFHAASTGREVVLYSRGGCSVFDLRSPMAQNRPECLEFVTNFLAEVDRQAQPGDVLFLPSLRVPRLAEAWGGRALGVKGVDDPTGRAAAVREAIDRLAPLAARGVRIVFEAPLPVFRIATVRCSDWFNAGNPSCRDVEVPQAEELTLRAPVMKAIAQIQQAVPGLEMWDPLPVLCPGASCSPYRDGQPLFVDGDHLSGYGNAVLLADFNRVLAAQGGPISSR